MILNWKRLEKEDHQNGQNSFFKKKQNKKSTPLWSTLISNDDSITGLENLKTRNHFLPTKAHNPLNYPAMGD